IHSGQTTLDDLTARMRDTTARMLAGRAFRFEVTGMTAERTVSLEFRRHIFLLYKEVLNNIVRHSQAGMVEIDVWIDRRGFKLQVHDDGKGFEPAAEFQGTGLAGLKRRVAQLRGECTVRSAPAEGTTIGLTVPIV
ncbi:MAG: sensor histidine kinase, partial [Planctomycetota bacterium]